MKIHPGARVVACLIAVLCAAGTFAGSAAARVTPHSSGPIVSNPATAPWSVLIVADDGTFTYQCSGTILDTTHILTAGHCVFDESNGDAEFTPGQITVSAGTVTNPAGSGAQTSKVSAIRVGPGYTGGTSVLTPNDVSELTLATPLKFNANVSAAAVAAPGTTPAPGTSVVNYAFGTDDPAEDVSPYERSLAATILPPWTCGDNHANIACTSSTQGDNCPGDSGSGIIQLRPTPTIVGVVDDALYGDQGGCTTGHSTTETDVTSPEIAAWLAGSATPPAPATITGGETLLYPGSSQVGSVMTCTPPTYANATGVSYLFIDAATNAVLQSGPSTFSVPATELGHTISCVSVGAGAGGVQYQQGGTSSPIAAQSPAGLRFSLTRRGRLTESNSGGAIVTVTVTPRGKKKPTYTKTLPAAKSLKLSLSRVLAGRYTVCVSSASAGVYAPASHCVKWSHDGSAARFLTLRALLLDHHQAVRVTPRGPLKRSRAVITWKGTRGHRTVTVTKHVTLKKGHTLLRAPRARGAHWRTLKISVKGRKALHVTLFSGSKTVRLRR